MALRNEKQDRRIKYTKTVLRDALVRLMRDRHISAISVKTLCDLADINRSTFYAHYRDPQDLLHQIQKEVLDTLKLRLNEMPPAETQDENNALPLSRSVLIRILDYVKENAELCKVLLSENCDFAFQKDIMELSQIVSLPVASSYSEHTKEYISIFGITGSISVFQKWLWDGMVEPAEELADILLKVLYSGSMSFAKA